MKQLLFVLFTYLVGINALYSSSSGVIDLTADNFKKLVINSQEVWLVEFYSPGCGHCRNLVPEYTKAAKALQGVIKVGGVNAAEHRQLGGQYKIRGYPTILIFGADKLNPEEFNGNRNHQAFIEAGFKAAKIMVNLALIGTKSSGGGESSDGSDVIELTDGNFNKNVLSGDMWLVEFFAPWCGHCKNLEPQWKMAASQLKGKVKLGALDATIHSVKASQYGVQGYPTIKFFNKGEVEDYNGGRSSNDIVQWALARFSEKIPAPEVTQLIDSKSLDSACKKNSICVIIVLPHLLDCQSKCRNDYIEMITKLADTFKSKMWGWLWSEAMSHTALEEALDMGGFGYPTLAVLNSKKMQFALFKGSFSHDGLKEFFRDISYGRGSTSPLKGAKLPKITASKAWDGKDGVLEAEEDIDLSDDKSEKKDEL